MPFPEVKHCLICEDVRLEARKKASLLGFYGIAPDVRIIIQDFNKPMARLFFMLLCESKENMPLAFQVRPEVRHESGDAIVNTVETEIRVVPGKNSLVFGFGPIKFTSPGTYSFRLFVGGRQQFECHFEAQQGKAEDFAS